MKYNVYDIGGVIAKQDDRYTVKDNTELKDLVLSSTNLLPGKQTTGHSHPGQEEIYFFISGSGEMLLDDTMIKVQTGDVVTIHDGVFHRVYNNTNAPLYFVCVFNGKRSH